MNGFKSIEPEISFSIAIEAGSLSFFETYSQVVINYFELGKASFSTS